MAVKRSGSADGAERAAKAKAKKNNVPQSTVTKGNSSQVRWRTTGKTGSFGVKNSRATGEILAGGSATTRAGSVAMSNKTSGKTSAIKAAAKKTGRK